MKRKALIFLIAGTTFLSAFGGGALFLTPQNHSEQTPTAIAGCPLATGQKTTISERNTELVTSHT